MDGRSPDLMEILTKIAAKFRSPQDPKEKYFDSLKDLREFQRKHPGYDGPLCLRLEGDGPGGNQ